MEPTRELGLDSVLALEQALQLWRAIQESIGQETADRWNAREEPMASRTMAPLERNQKVIVWAQNGHIQCQELRGLPPGSATMGQILRQKLQKEYVAIAGVFGSGSYRGFDLESGGLRTADVGAPPPTTLDYALLSMSNNSAMLVTMANAHESLHQSQHTRWAGAELVSSDEMITTVTPALSSDAIAFVPHTNPSTPLEA